MRSLARGSFVFAYGLACFLSLRAFAAETEEGVFHNLRFTNTDHLMLSNAQAPGMQTGPYTNLFMHEDKPRLEYDNYSVGVHFTDRLTTNGPLDKVSPFYLEKAYGAADWDTVSLRLGDSYQTVGRGIILALYQDASFGIDATLQGGAIRYHPSVVDATVMAGRVNPIHNPVALRPFDYPIKDHNFWVAGGNVTVNATKQTHIGAQYVRSMSQPLTGDVTGFDQTWDAVGVTLAKENLLENLDVYVEANRLYSQQPESPTPVLPTGHGSYASITWSPSAFQFRLEGLNYDNFYYPFQKPPTLEYKTVAFLNTESESAARLYGEYRTDAGATFFSSVLTGWDTLQFYPIYHPILGAKFNGPAHTHYELDGGYRDMAYFGRMWHASLEFRVRTLKGQSVELVGQSINWTRGANTAFQTIDYRNLFNLTYTFSERVNASLGYEYIPESSLTTGHNFFNVGGTFKTGGLTAKAFVGQTSGGMQCSGGICRQVPAYSGAMLETNYVF